MFPEVDARLLQCAATSVREARSLMETIKVVSDAYQHGDQWVKRVYVPSLNVLAKSRRRYDQRLASIGYYVLGDVHDFNDAPKAAIRAYRRSISLCEEHGAAWREMGILLDGMGHHRRARNALQKAVALAPDDDLAKSELDGFSAQPPDDDSALYKSGDPYWESSELMARGWLTQALARVVRRQGTKACRWRARIYGAMEERERVLREWKRMVGRSETFEVRYPDLFFLPKSVWDSPDFWCILWKLRPQIANWMTFDFHDSLFDAGVTGRKHVDLYLQYHLARTRRDLAAARKLTKACPTWQEARVLVRRLRCEHGSS